MERVLEPEVMDDPEEANLYNDMDHSEVNRRFVEEFLATGDIGNDILDLGTGTALIPIELCRQHPTCRVMASDAAVSMLDLARYNVAIASLDQRIQLHHGDSKSLVFETAMFDAVISNSLIHHLPNPKSAMGEIIRVCRPGGRIFVRDLCRPNDEEQVEEFVKAYTANEPDASQQMFRQSLMAALTLDEVRSLVAEFGYPQETVQMSSDRHWTWSTERNPNLV